MQNQQQQLQQPQQQQLQPPTSPYIGAGSGGGGTPSSVSSLSPAGSSALPTHSLPFSSSSNAARGGGRNSRSPLPPGPSSSSPSPHGVVQAQLLSLATAVAPSRHHHRSISGGGSSSAAAAAAAAAGMVPTLATVIAAAPPTDPTSSTAMDFNDGDGEGGGKGRGGAGNKAGKASCHACKTMRALPLLLTCTLDGEGPKRTRRCRKRFCAACLSRLYDLTVERVHQPARDKWRCPACLSVCICAACKKRDAELGIAPVEVNPSTGLPLHSPYVGLEGPQGANLVYEDHPHAPLQLKAHSHTRATPGGGGSRVKLERQTVSSVSSASNAPSPMPVMHLQPPQQQQQQRPHAHSVDCGPFHSASAGLPYMIVPPQQHPQQQHQHQSHAMDEGGDDASNAQQHYPHHPQQQQQQLQQQQMQQQQYLSRQHHLPAPLCYTDATGRSGSAGGDSGHSTVYAHSPAPRSVSAASSVGLEFAPSLGGGGGGGGGGAEHAQQQQQHYRSSFDDQDDHEHAHQQHREQHQQQQQQQQLQQEEEEEDLDHPRHQGQQRSLLVLRLEDESGSVATAAPAHVSPLMIAHQQPQQSPPRHQQQQQQSSPHLSPHLGSFNFIPGGGVQRDSSGGKSPSLAAARRRISGTLSLTVPGAGAAACCGSGAATPPPGGEFALSAPAASSSSRSLSPGGRPLSPRREHPYLVLGPTVAAATVAADSSNRSGPGSRGVSPRASPRLSPRQSRGSGGPLLARPVDNHSPVPATALLRARSLESHPSSSSLSLHVPGLGSSSPSGGGAVSPRSHSYGRALRHTPSTSAATVGGHHRHQGSIGGGTEASVLVGSAPHHSSNSGSGLLFQHTPNSGPSVVGSASSVSLLASSTACSSGANSFTNSPCHSGMVGPSSPRPGHTSPMQALPAEMMPQGAGSHVRARSFGLPPSAQTASSNAPPAAAAAIAAAAGTAATMAPGDLQAQTAQLAVQMEHMAAQLAHLQAAQHMQQAQAAVTQQLQQQQRQLHSFIQQQGAGGDPSIQTQLDTIAQQLDVLQQQHRLQQQQQQQLQQQQQQQQQTHPVVPPFAVAPQFQQPPQQSPQHTHVHARHVQPASEQHPQQQLHQQQPLRYSTSSPFSPTSVLLHAQSAAFHAPQQQQLQPQQLQQQQQPVPHVPPPSLYPELMSPPPPSLSSDSHGEVPSSSHPQQQHGSSVFAKMELQSISPPPSAAGVHEGEQVDQFMTPNSLVAAASDGVSARGADATAAVASADEGHAAAAIASNDVKPFFLRINSRPHDEIADDITAGQDAASGGGGGDPVVSAPSLAGPSPHAAAAATQHQHQQRPPNRFVHEGDGGMHPRGPAPPHAASHEFDINSFLLGED